MSFGSELFRRVIAAGGGQPSESVLSERDRLREPHARLEEDTSPAPIVDRLNQELRGFFRTAPTLHLRVTATDSNGLLESVVSHYAHEGGGLPLPARRHGSGLLSLQHLLLLLQFGRMRAEAREGFWMALEEPELHVPPSLQRRLVHRIQALSRQTFVSTHSPMVAALADPTGVLVLRNVEGVLTAVPLLTSTLAADTPNSVRKLFRVNRVETIAAAMHEFVLVPEGRTDYEWLGLLVRAVDLHQSWAAADECRFAAFVGVVPTHDGAVVRTAEAMAPLHPRIVAMVDGDAEGVGYAAALVAGGSPNSGVIIRWAEGEMLEDTIGWILDADANACLLAIQS
ncbi:AAA family ATPase (plasmid) [Devosia sp. A8/3-2]|nr:AAA family ATPase [Devosia sp. A8/3-2]